MKRVVVVVLSLTLAAGVSRSQEKAAEKEPPLRPATVFYYSSTAKEIDNRTNLPGHKGDVLLRKGANVTLVGGAGKCFVEAGARVSTVGGAWALIIKQDGALDRPTGGQTHIYAEKDVKLPPFFARPIALDRFAAITFAPLEPYTLQGSVRDSSGKARTGIRVRAYSLDDSLMDQTTTDDHGNFKFRCKNQVRHLAADIGSVWKKRPALLGQADLDFLRRVQVLRGWETAIEEGFWGKDATVPIVYTLSDGVTLPAPLSLGGHEMPIQAMAFSADSAILATVSLAAKPCLWDVRTGKQIGVILPPRNEPFNAMRAFHTPNAQWLLDLDPKGKHLALMAAGVNFGVWDRESGERLHQLPQADARRNPSVCAAYSPDGRILAWGGQGGAIHAWDADSGKERPLIQTNLHSVNGLCFSPDGRHILAAGVVLGGNRNVAFENAARVRVWDVASGREVRALDGEADLLRFSSDGARLVGIGSRRKVERLPNGGMRIGPEYHAFVWDYASGRQLMKALTRADTFAFAHGGLLLLTASNEDIRLWEVDSGQEILRCPLPQRDVCRVAFSPDGRTLAVGQQDGTVYLWSIRALRLYVPEENRFSEKAWAKLGENLAADSAALAYRALWTLLAEPPRAVKLMKQHLRPTAAQEFPFEKWIANLDDDDFDRRQQAEKSLRKAGAAAEAALRQARDGKPTLEARRRIDMLLEEIVDHRASPEELRSLRAIQLLEEIGSPEARELLQSLANGSNESRQTQEAKAALKRLG